MTKFHINSKGVPAPCKATKDNCPFGGNTGKKNHFDTAEEAQEFVDKQNEAKYGILSEPSKLKSLSHKIGTENALNKIAKNMSIGELRRTNKKYIEDYDLDDFIDNDISQVNRFAQIRRFLGNDVVIDNLPEYTNETTLNNVLNEIDKQYDNDRKEQTFRTLDNLVDKVGTEKTIDNLEKVIPNKKINVINDDVINDYDLDDYIDEDLSEIGKFGQIRRFLGDETVLKEMSDKLSVEELDKYLSLSIKYFLE